MYLCIAKRPNIDKIKEHLQTEGYGVDMAIKNDMNALMIAASEGSPDTLQLILDA